MINRPGLLIGILGLAAILGMTACGSDSGDDVSSGDGSATTAAANRSATTTTAGAASGSSSLAADLRDRTFLSTSVEGHDLATDSVIRITFEGEVMAVNGGCNTITGAYKVEADTLAWVDTPAATMMACEEPLMAQDTWLTEVLTAGLEASLDRANLVLSGDEVTITLEEEADAPLTGTKWTLESIVANDAVSSLPTGVTPPTLDIADDGTVTFSSGCNSGGGSVVIGDFDGEGVLDFGVMRVTLMACEGDGAPVEASVLAVLDGEVEVSIDGQVLTLTNGGQGLQYRAS